MKASSISNFNVSRRDLLIALAWTAVILLSLEIALRFSLPEAQFSRFMAVRAREMVEVPGAPIQIYGDSVADGALNEKVLAESAGLPFEDIVNCSLPSSSALFASAQLRRQITAGTAPQILILAYSPQSYAVPMVPKFISHFATLNEIPPVLREARPSLELILRGLLDRTSKSMRYRENFNTIARTGEGMELFQPRITPTVSLAERRHTLHAVEAEVLEDQSRAVMDDRIAYYYNQTFKHSAEIQRSLTALLDLAAAHDIQVWLVSMPKPPSTQALHDRNGYNTAYEQMLMELSKHPAMTLLMKESLTLPASDFLDGVHLNRRAGIRFSSRVGRLTAEARSESHPNS